jgi:hypothetical protein
MAYSDPQTVTINAIANTLARVSSGDGFGAFRNSDGTVYMTVRHQNGKRYRRQIRLTLNKISADPFIPDRNVASNATVYMVVDHPINGFTNTEIKQLVDGFTAYLTASSGAKVTQLLGGEN